MWLNESANYKYLNNETVKKAEEHFQTELNELKREIETNELVHGIGFNRSFASVPVPKDAQILAKERKLYIEKMLQVHDIRKPYIQADIMLEQNENCLKEEYTTESLPLILHQFFTDKISWCVHAKHAHLLRWKRFTENTNIIEEMYTNFKNRIGYILSDYNDSIKRSQRLSQARDLLLTTNSSALAMNAIEIEDIEIYLRWLISHFYSQKTFQQAVKILQWLPYDIYFDSNSSNPAYNRNDDNLSTNRTSRHKSMNTDRLDSIRQSSESNNKTGNSSSIGSFLINRFKMLDNIYLPTSNAHVARDEVLNTVSIMFNQDEMPVHDNTLDYLMPRLRFLVNLYKIDYNLSRMQTSGDEMELFAAVNRRYRHLFAQQEHMKTFRTYDSVEIGSENWGADSSIHALKKESNWLDYVQLVPQKDPIYEKDIAKLKQKHSIDQYLLSHNSFIEIKNDERVQEALRENSTLVKNQPNIEAVSVTTNITQFNTNSLWKRIFHNPNLDSQTEKPSDNLDLLNNTTVQVPKPISFRSKSNKKQDEFSFIENLQKLGLDDSKTNDQNLSNVQGSYLSFLLLRHLRIRDLKRQALGFLNFFRSIEKTITIYDGGLSLESSNYKRTSAQNYSKETPYGGNLGNHSYIFNTPKDFRLNESEFMEFSEIDNHDDFYSVDERGFVHVQDQRGYFIMYDAALNDMKKLENELLMIASYYIAKDKETYEPNKNKRDGTQNINLEYYAHQNVDRFSVLLDIWTNEVNFLEMKKNLMEIYYEAYQNVFDKNEKRNLAQIITNIMYQRVRFDLHSDYFTQSYRLEVSCLNKQCRIVKLILDRMIDEMRNYLEKVDDSKFGLPLSLIKKSAINLSSNLYGHTLKNFYLLEFHPCLASASRLPPAFKQSIEELVYFKSVQNVTERLLIEQNFYNIYLEKLERLNPPGYTFTPQIQKEIFNGMFVEDPVLMPEFVQQSLRQLEESLKHKTRKEQTDGVLKLLSHFLEVLTLRHRLLSASFETEILSNQYKLLAREMGFEEFHMYLRYVQFDFAKHKENADNPPPAFVSELNNDDSQIDRYVPNMLYLTINELEEGQIGRLSFKAKENIQQIMRPGGLENLQLIVKLQLMNNNALISSIMQANACLLSNNLAARKNSVGLNNPGNVVEEDKFNENSMFNIKQFNGSSAIDSGPSIRINNAVSKLKKFSDAFVSIQLEKNPYRDMMLNEYIKQKETKGLLLSNPAEMEKLKRNLMNDYANKFTNRCVQYSLRAQLITLYYSMTKILEHFPNTRDNHFVFGEPNEKRNLMNSRQLEIDNGNNKKSQVTDETIDYIRSDPRTFKKRPRKLLSDDGERLLNLWFIPHYTDLLLIYKKNFTNDQTVKALKHSVRILSALNDILNFLYANACMNIAVNSSAATDSSTASIRKKIDFSSWENSGGLDTELNELQLEINQLNDPCDPEQVAELLELKRSSMILQYDCAIRHAVRDIFLANGNVEAFKIVNENMQFSLKFLNDYSVDTDENVYLNVPEPFDCRDSMSSQLFPWRTFISKYGPFPLKYFQWFLIEPNVSMCITGLKDIEKNVANGEILGVTLLMEDLLNSDNYDDSEFLDALMPSSDQTQVEKPQQNSLTGPETQSVIKKNRNLIHNYTKWRYFLLTWKRVELLKLDWARRKLFLENINTPELYMRFTENYKKEVLVPVLKILIRKTDSKDIYENLVDFKQPILLPPNVSELESKIKQILRLFEKLELSMIDETAQRVQKELKLVIAERSRDENTLTTDLWKKPIMKEEFTINKPHIADEFTQMFFNLAQFQEETVNGVKKLQFKIDEEDIKNCMIRLGTLVQEREKSNYEQYAMYYENIIRQQHQLLYNKEREVKAMKDKIEAKKMEVNVEVQCQMADICYDIIMEITALRAKLTELTESKENLEKELRHKVKKEFIDLVTDLVNVNTSLKSQLDLFKENIHADVLEVMNEVKQQAYEEVQKLKEKQARNCEVYLSEMNRKQADLIRQLEKERNELNMMLIIHKNFNKHRMVTNLNTFNKKLSEVTEVSNVIKRKEIDNSLLADQKQTLINQQKSALKRQLSRLDIDFNNLKLKLEKELKEKQNRDHELAQKMKNERNLNSAKRSNVEKLFEELEAKDIELRNLHMHTEKSNKLQTIQGSKIQREISSLRKKLLEERNLKLDAFQKVDELQSHVYDLEDNLLTVANSRPNTTSSNQRASRVNFASSKNSSPFPKLNGFSLNHNGMSSSMSNRPKTTTSRYKLNETDEFMNGDDDDSSEFYHETILKLKESRLKSAKL